MNGILLEGASLGPFGPVSVEFGAGLHVVLGRPSHGSVSLVELVAGCRRPRLGRVSVAGADPARTPALRRSMGSLLASETLPPGRLVADTLRLLLRAHAASDGADALARLELSHWAQRPTRDLDAAERRSVVLAAILALRAPVAVVLYEPLSDLPGVPALAVLEQLGALASEGVCVLCVTASLTDASACGGRLWLLRSGQLVPSSSDSQILLPGAPLRWRMRTERTREFAALLLGTPEITAVAYDAARSPNELEVSTRDASVTALHLLTVAKQAGVRVESLRAVLPSLDEVQAASTGATRGAYERAYQAAREGSINLGIDR